MLKRIIILVMLGKCAAVQAQSADIYADDLKWPEKPALHQTPSLYHDADAVFLADDRIYELRIEDKNAVQYNKVYRLIRVNNDKGIEQFNRVYIPVYANAEIQGIKARVITSAGKIIDIPEEKIKESVEDGRKYKLIAMEGLDNGSEIEYTYTTKKPVSFFGTEVFQGKDVPYAHARITVISPSYLKYAVKGYNGFKVLPDTVINEKRIIVGYSDNIGTIGEEKYGLREPYLQRVDYKLAYNLSKDPNVELYTWKELASKIYANLTNYSEKEKKATAKFISSANIPANATDEQTICLLEDYMKTKINADDKYSSEHADEIDAIIKTGNTTSFGITRFFIAMMENKGIKYRVVFPSVRDQLPLDEHMENWNRIDETMLYFPSTGKYMEPSDAALRYPFVTAYWAGTRGLVLTGTTIGDVQTATSRFDTIPIMPVDLSAENMEEDVKLNSSNDSLIINSRQILKGYAAMGYRPIWAFLDKDKQDDAVKDIVKSVAESDDIRDIKAENTKLTDAWDNKPLIISATIHTAELLDRAGNNLLFKVGQLIGPQEQMYQEKERELPAELEFPHVLDRTIRFEIPADYTIKNPDDIKMSVVDHPGAAMTMGFVSTYKITGNILEIDIKETYRNIKYPLDEFETFKKVINASADFNKVVLVLEKKK